MWDRARLCVKRTESVSQGPDVDASTDAASPSCAVIAMNRTDGKSEAIASFMAWLVAGSWGNARIIRRSFSLSGVPSCPRGPAEETSAGTTSKPSKVVWEVRPDASIPFRDSVADAIEAEL